MRATYLLYYEFEVKSSVFVRRTHWRLCPVNGRLREARGPGVPGHYRQSKLRRKKISKDPARVTTRTQPGGMMAKTEPERLTIKSQAPKQNFREEF